MSETWVPARPFSRIEAARPSISRRCWASFSVSVSTLMRLRYPAMRLGTLIGTFAVLLAMAAGTAGAATPVQLPGTAGCVSLQGEGGCAPGRAVAAAERPAAVSPDGKNVYLVAQSNPEAVEGDAIDVFDRDPTSGALTQKAGAEGCFAASGRDGCAKYQALHGANEAAVSPDGRNVYVATGAGIVVFARDATTGALTPRRQPDRVSRRQAAEGAVQAEPGDRRGERARLLPRRRRALRRQQRLPDRRHPAAQPADRGAQPAGLRALGAGPGQVRRRTDRRRRDRRGPRQPRRPQPLHRRRRHRLRRRLHPGRLLRPPGGRQPAADRRADRLPPPAGGQGLPGRPRDARNRRAGAEPRRSLALRRLPLRHHRQGGRGDDLPALRRAARSPRPRARKRASRRTAANASPTRPWRWRTRSRSAPTGPASTSPASTAWRSSTAAKSGELTGARRRGRLPLRLQAEPLHRGARARSNRRRRRQPRLEERLRDELRAGRPGDLRPLSSPAGRAGQTAAAVAKASVGAVNSRPWSAATAASVRRPAWTERPPRKPGSAESAFCAPSSASRTT